MGVKLTAGEAEVIRWALSPMRDFWCTESGASERDGAVYPEDQLPVMSDDELVLSPVEEVNEDLQYRVTEQLADMASDAGGFDAQGRADAEAMDGLRTLKAIKVLKRKLGWED